MKVGEDNPKLLGFQTENRIPNCYRVIGLGNSRQDMVGALGGHQFLDRISLVIGEV